jgi:hypothetical protein
MARADLTWEFTDSGGNVVAGNNFTVGQGLTLDIRVYLLETNGGTILSTSGLSSAGVQLTGSNSNAQVASASNITPNAAFDQNSKSVSGNAAILNESVLANPNVVAPTTGPDANRILIGTFTYTGNTVGTTSIATSDPHPTSADTVSGSGTTLDGMIFNATGTINVVAVPEPGSLILTGLAAAGIAAGAWRWRRRRQPAVA